MQPHEAVEAAARLLNAAEFETNPITMERLDDLAMTWLRMAELLCEHTEARTP